MRLLLLFTLITFSVCSQVDTIDSPMRFPDQEAKFPGGHAALNKYVFENLVFPDSLLQEDVEGRIYLEMVIRKDGSVAEPIVVKTFSRRFDEMAKELVLKMPKWKPAMHRGKEVDQIIRFPMNIYVQ